MPTVFRNGLMGMALPPRYAKLAYPYIHIPSILETFTLMRQTES